MPNITILREKPRGCGYRKPGGMYLRTDGIGSACLKLNIPLTVCPCCGGGVKQARGWTWVNTKLFESPRCPKGCEVDWKCTCPFGQRDLRMGLMWVGASKFYPTPEAFAEEAAAYGVSKRLHQIPKDFRVGQTWVALAHPKACPGVDEKGSAAEMPGIFHAFRPSRIEYVVKGTETEDELKALEKRGLSLVQVIPLDEDGEEIDDRLDYQFDEDL